MSGINPVGHPLLRQAVIGNAGSLVAFRIGAEDAPLIANELGIDNMLTLTDTSNFSAWAKLTSRGNPTDPIMLKTVPSHSEHSGAMQAVIARTRARHSRPRIKVEQLIARFLSGS